MPGTPSETMLQVYIYANSWSVFWRSNILETAPDDMAFFCTLFVGVRYLLNIEHGDTHDAEHDDDTPPCKVLPPSKECEV